MILALVGGAPRDLGPRLVAALRDRWTASYAVSFGPPLVGANPALRERLATAAGAFDKLLAYADTCLVPEKERLRLYWKHRARVRSDDRRVISARSTEALDVGLRLHHPSTAPTAVTQEMAAAGLDLTAIPTALEGQLMVRLDDPFGAGVGARIGVEEEELILELVIDPAALHVWSAWAARLPATRAVAVAS